VSTTSKGKGGFHYLVSGPGATAEGLGNVSCVYYTVLASFDRVYLPPGRSVISAAPVPALAFAGALHDIANELCDLETAAVLAAAASAA